MDELKRERVYSNGVWSVIKRTFENDETRFSVVRYGSAFFDHTFTTLNDAIDYCDQNL